MSNNLTENAMIAKVQGMFQKRLNSSDYSELASKRSIADVASYLKKETYFSEVLEDINEQNIHRGQLEMLVRKNTYQKMMSLAHYINIDKNAYYHLVVYNYEISIILMKIRSLRTNQQQGLETNYITVDEKYATFNYNGLFGIKDFSELLEYLKNTPYYQPLKQFEETNEDEMRYTEIEQALHNEVVILIEKAVDEVCDHEVAKKIDRMLDIRNELINVSRIYRLKKYFNPTEEDIRKLIIVKPVIIPAKMWESWIKGRDVDQIYDDVLTTGYRKYLKNTSFTYIEHQIYTVFYQMAKYEIRNSGIAEIVYYQYMNFLNVEVDNIISVIEGVRYGYDANKTLARIVQ